jgi:hypothetical protein
VSITDFSTVTKFTQSFFNIFKVFIVPFPETVLLFVWVYSSLVVAIISLFWRVHLCVLITNRVSSCEWRENVLARFRLLFGLVLICVFQNVWRTALFSCAYISLMGRWLKASFYKPLWGFTSIYKILEVFLNIFNPQLPFTLFFTQFLFILPHDLRHFSF